jgi:cytochrome c peroxidase
MKYGFFVLLLLTGILACKRENTVVTDYAVPDLPAVPFDYSTLSLPVHFLTDVSGMLPTSVNGTDNNPSDNPVTNHGATLGRVLFYDKNLSANGAISCATCHQQENGFSDKQLQRIGLNGTVPRRHSMTLINTRFYQRGRFFWDERSASLEEQVLVPISNAAEQGITMHDLLERVATKPFYTTLFTNAFGSSEVSTERIARALAQFVRSIVSYSSKYDSGRAFVSSPLTDFPNFTEAENLGKQLFFKPVSEGGGNCFSCHTTEAFINIGSGPKNIGLDSVSILDFGALETFPDIAAFSGSFKTSTLRNIALTAPYMHDGRFRTLEQVIEHYNNGIKNHPALAAELKDAEGNPLRLNFTAEEKAALAAFLKTLTDHSVATNEKWSNPFKP